MRRAAFGLALGLVLMTGAVGAATAPGRLVVHEWGTFLVMQGGDGATLDGMYHEEHALPAFVHARSRDQQVSILRQGFVHHRLEKRVVVDAPPTAVLGKARPGLLPRLRQLDRRALVLHRLDAAGEKCDEKRGAR